MELRVSRHAADLAFDAARYIQGSIGQNSVIGVATGRTPLALYQALAELGDISVVGGFALDEYLGVGEEQPGSFASYVRENVEPALRLSPGLIRVPNGLAKDPQAEADEFEAEILKSPIDLQILGVGANGHLAFNEPGSSATSLTRVVELSEQTRQDNQPDFPGEIPKKAITQGIGTISRAGKLCLLASGEKKVEALRRLLMEEEDESWPVTLISKHADLMVFTDEKTLGLTQN
jgi:glucosamine-6-phosphate deaminase